MHPFDSILSIWPTFYQYVVSENEDLHLQRKRLLQNFTKINVPTLIGRDKTVLQQSNILRCHLGYLELPISRNPAIFDSFGA